MRPLADGALVLVTLIWGTTFVVVKIAVETVDPFAFIGARFALGAFVLALYTGARRTIATPRLARDGAILGLVLFAGFALQTLGLRESTPARAAFITGLNVVMVPLLVGVIQRRAPGRGIVAGVALGAAGMAVLAAPLTWAELAGGSRWGDLLVFGCAIAFALHIVGVGHVARHHDAAAFTGIQLGVTALLAGIAASWVRADVSTMVLAAPAILYMGLIATGGVFWLQTWAQRHAAATHTALIFTLEPVFAALFSWAAYGEQLTVRMAVGGALIVCGIVLAELIPARA